MIFRKLEKVLLAIVFCIGMVFMAAPLSAFAATSVMVVPSDNELPREVRYDVKSREVVITLVTDGFKDEYFMDGTYVKPSWKVFFTDGKNEYSVSAETKWEEFDPTVAMYGYISNNTTNEMSECSISISGNEVTWTATLPEDVFVEPIAVDAVEFTDWSITETHDIGALNEFFMWSLDDQGNATLRDGQGTIPFNEFFGYASEVKSIDVNVKSFPLEAYMFSGFSNLETATLKAESTTGEWLSGMFDGCQKLRKVDLSGFHNASVRSAIEMFNNCSSLTDVNLSGLNTKNVLGMDYMFGNCSSLKNLDLSSLDTRSVRVADYMFSNCNKLESLDLSGFDMGSLISANGFLDCVALQTIRTPKNMAQACKLPEFDGLWKNESAEKFFRYLPKNEKSSQTLIRERFASVSDLEIAKKSLSLCDTISIDFRVDKSVADKYRNLYLLVEQDAVIQKIDAYHEIGDYLVFQYRVAPYMMNEEITAVICAEDAQGQRVIGTPFKYSVAEYCYNMLNKEEYQSDTYKSFRRLLVDILNYGDAAQKYMDYKTNNLAGSELTAEMLSLGTQGLDMTYENVKKPDYETVSNSWAEITNASLFLEASVNVLFKFSTNSLEGLTLVVTDGTNILDVIQPDSAILDSDGRYFVKFKKLNAAQMRKTIYATVMKGDQKVSNTYRYSIESYVFSRKGTNGQKMDDLLDAMMRYGDSAKNYVEFMASHQKSN